MPDQLSDVPAAVVARFEAEAERFTTPFDGGRMVWRRWGAGPPVVLLHGASGSWTHWIRNLEGLAERFAVLVPDMPGFGESDALPEPHTAERLADAVVAGLAAHARLDLVGFSFGGIVAGLAAARLGTRARRLVLLGPGGMAFRSDVGRLVLARVEPGMSEAEAREVHRANLQTLMLADPAAADDLAVHLQVDNLRRARFKSGTIPASDVLLRAMPGIRARIAALFGGRDAFAVPYLDERRETLARFQSDLDFRVVAGAGHWVNYEAPATVNRALREMLA
ncbi:MAG TPA: alpha/beta fold hydrolase [Methylomirabilota bacterium]